MNRILKLALILHQWMNQVGQQREGEVVRPTSSKSSLSEIRQTRAQGRSQGDAAECNKCDLPSAPHQQSSSSQHPPGRSDRDPARLPAAAGRPPTPPLSSSPTPRDSRRRRLTSTLTLTVALARAATIAAAAGAAMAEGEGGGCRTSCCVRSRCASWWTPSSPWTATPTSAPPSSAGCARGARLPAPARRSRPGSSSPTTRSGPSSPTCPPPSGSESAGRAGRLPPRRARLRSRACCYRLMVAVCR